MAVRKVPQTWQAECDGREFPTESQAKAHDELIEAGRSYENAKRHFGRLLAETQKTADGKRFDLSMLSDYYYVAPTYGGMPRLARLSFYYHYCYFGFDESYRGEGDDQLEISLCENGDPKTLRNFRVKNLYRSEEAANAALLIEQERWLEEATEDIAALRKKLSKTESAP